MKFRDILTVGCLSGLLATTFWNMDIFAGSGELTIQEMDQTRGTSQMVCKFQQSCDAYNHYSGNCAGLPDDTPCITCEGANTTVDYLDMSNGMCTGGWKYDSEASLPVNCGGQSKDGKCKNQICTANEYYILLKCDQPNLITNQ